MRTHAMIAACSCTQSLLSCSSQWQQRAVTQTVAHAAAKSPVHIQALVSTHSSQPLICQRDQQANGNLHPNSGRLHEQDDEYNRMLKAGGAEVDALLRALAQQREEAQAVCAEQLKRLEASFRQVR